MRRNMFIVLLVILSIVVVVACEKQNEGKEKEILDTERVDATLVDVTKPVTINVFELGAQWTHEMFMDQYGNQIQKKYPAFTFKIYSANPDFGGVGIPELIAQGVSLDMIKVLPQSVYPTLIANNLHGDISDLIKKYNYDLNSLYPSVQSTMRVYGDHNEIYGIPNGAASVTLFYNKDIFDKFGQDYPSYSKPMTWDEAYDLARRLTRPDGDIQYYGFQSDPGTVFGDNQLSQGYLDTQTNKATLNTDNWRMMFNNLARFYSIDGNEYLGNAFQAFWEHGHVAMYATQGGGWWSFAENTTFNWDLVELPRYKEKPEAGPSALIPFYAVAKTSKVRDQAFLAAAYIGSEDFQIPFAKQGYRPPLKIDKITEMIGSEVPYLAGKNISAAVPLDSAAPGYALNEYHSLIVNEIPNAFRFVVSGEKDIATALREAEEAANIIIEAAKSGK